MATATPPPANPMPVSRPPIILPSRGVARVKNVLSGDTVILLGKASTPNGKAPEVIFTLENISAPRYVSITAMQREFFFRTLRIHIYIYICSTTERTDPLDR